MFFRHAGKILLNLRATNSAIKTTIKTYLKIGAYGGGLGGALGACYGASKFPEIVTSHQDMVNQIQKDLPLQYWQDPFSILARGSLVGVEFFVDRTLYGAWKGAIPLTYPIEKLFEIHKKHTSADELDQPRKSLIK